MAEYFPPKFFFFFISAIFFRGKKGIKVGPKVQTPGISCFCKNLSFSKILKVLFLFPGILPVVKILAESGNIWGELGPRTSPKGAISWMLNRYEKLWKFLTWQSKMLYSYHDYASLWDLSFAKKLGRNSNGVIERKRKTSESEPENQFFGLISWNF